MSLQHVTISVEVTSATLGQAWIKLVDQILQNGTPMGEEGLEVLGIPVRFLPAVGSDEILERFADHQMIGEMKKVFFGNDPSSLGHSYAKLIRGPGGRHDLQDVIELLEQESLTKRAVVTLPGQAGGKVPCVTAVQFLVRNSIVQTTYFARGQDAFKKFYADALCLVKMAEKVAEALRLSIGPVYGFIGSAHIYHQDMPSIRQILISAKNYLTQHRQEGILA
jgi:thymidylate synthase